MSLEASLDEENREVLAALDRRRASSPLPRVRGLRIATPPPPVRSMLDVDSPTPRHGSIAGIGVGITSPDPSRRSTKLDPSNPSTYTSAHSSKSNSPVLTKSQPAYGRARTSSEADGPVGLPKIAAEEKRAFEQSYQFDMASIPSSARSSARSPAESKRPREGSVTAMQAAMTGDFASLNVGLPAGGSGRHNSTVTSGTHSRSPSSRIRIAEPSKPGFLSPTKASAPLTTKAGTVVDDQAHRRLSNKSSSFSTITDDSEKGAGRVAKDEVAEEDAVADSSDEDIMSPSSDEDETRGRSGRRKTSDVEAEKTKSPSPNGTASPEVEIKSPPVQHPVKSLLEPSISVTSPTGEKVTEGKAQVHPSNNFASSPSVVSADDEDDELAAIRKAKTLALNISPLDSTVTDRHVRIILRGNWSQFDQEAKEGERHNRTYLVCSDLSVEASYALEWVVGTMLRDGDTILAIYAIEDESAGKATEADREVLQAEGVQAGKDASDIMQRLTRQTTQGGGTSFGMGTTNKYVPATELQSLTGSVDARSVSKREMERLRAVDEITQNFLKFVRKTTLQVRCMVEVIHCKSPKHLILGAIDELEPTLCVVGTRGRSSLRGVLLGSFSNYLVTKSSVPVMVARKRLKKPRSGIRVSSTKIRLSNNLTASNMPTKRRSLTQARID
ncbi:hypothetical protein A1O1_02132 [Capronia coronata CBS 617.96]|uniref:UspA domain-containing protein n=1 Tax=Capronia coronata CBS 617.96 TaxID=1182541 RepID=W9ZGU8_9EURO|nr:uncharacterized protein A1O1_02132 [Capronia coronata CBS 617.96]EXJ93739.1 hypothetical protein A1O1_02132 [Capronia coronata CBS 617.96]